MPAPDLRRLTVAKSVEISSVRFATNAMLRVSDLTFSSAQAFYATIQAK
jgi:hypothetical protein